MKKLFTILSICIVASILFASCGSHVSIKKRLYSKGFYISGSKDKADGSSSTYESETNNKSEGITIGNSRDYSVKLSVQPNEENSKIEPVPELKEKKILETDLSLLKVKDEATIIESEKIVTKDSPLKFQPTKWLKKKSMSNGMQDHEHGLSLFWIVILVILILWAVGFFAGSVGSLINLLLLVALILLILWLLRVI